jgi:hypothetical protein
VFGPTTAGAFARWAGIRPAAARTAFEALAAELTPAHTPVGEALILSRDEASFRAPTTPAAPARLLPSGDAYFLLHGADRDLLVPDADRRGELWTLRVWPGAVLVAGEIVGTWRRADARVTVESWRDLTRAERDSVEDEAHSLPLPGLRGPIVVRWSD